VSQTRPLLPEFGRVREQIQVATYEGTLDSFLSIVEELRQGNFRPGTYNVVHRNCNHFSDALLQAVCGARVPEWVNRAANMGSGLSLGAGGASSSETTNTFVAPGKAKPPSLSAKTVDDNESECRENNTSASSSSSSGLSSVFNWIFGGSSTSSSTATTQSGVSDSSPIDKKKVSATDTKKKKELTEKQKEMLSKLKANKK
jgi:hypothetical protein